MKPSLIIVDDDFSMAKIISLAAQTMAFDTHVATSADEFMDLYGQIEPSAIVMDVVMPGMDGIELLEWLADRGCDVPIILISGYGKYYIKTAAHLGSIKGIDIIGTLMKPFELTELDVSLQRVLDSREA